MALYALGYNIHIYFLSVSYPEGSIVWYTLLGMITLPIDKMFQRYFNVFNLIMLLSYESS